MTPEAFDRVGLVVHPARPLERALAAVRAWAQRQGADVVQIPAPGSDRVVARPGDPAACDLVIALGGDGTTLAALHAAAPHGRPVLGVACGSLGALTAVNAGDLEDALARVAAGQWTARVVPGLAAAPQDGERLLAVNDLVLMRRAAGQVVIELRVDGELVIRYAGDGLIAATPLGSTAYTLAAGGPMLAPGAAGMVLTPLAPHGGVCPPLVTAPESRIEISLDPGHGGARVEVDGRVRAEAGPSEPQVYTLTYEPRFGELVALSDHESPIAALRRRRLLIDSPRVLARDGRPTPGGGGLSHPAPPDAQA